MNDIIQEVLNKHKILLYYRISDHDGQCHMIAAVNIVEPDEEYYKFGIKTCFLQIGLGSPCPRYSADNDGDLLFMNKSFISIGYIPLHVYCLHHGLSILRLMHTITLNNINCNKFVCYNSQAADILNNAITELLEISIKKNHSANVIQKVWLQKYYDPNEAICKRRLIREVNKMNSCLSDK